jgi:DedD protein
VQIGAFADANSVRETRAKVDKLGLRTYTQSVDTDSGKRTRVRLGPFASRDEADQAAAKVKAAGLPAAVFAL